MSEKLKPCPFCGGEAAQGMFTVWCSRCYVETEKDVDAEETEVAAIWNKRVSAKGTDKPGKGG